MTKVNVFEVKAKLSEYLDRAIRGERIIVCRHNTPVAELRGIQCPRSAPRPIGRLRGRPVFEVPAAFFEPLAEEELADWEGGASGPLAVSSPPAGRRRTPRVVEGGADARRREPKRTSRRPPRRRP